MKKLLFILLLVGFCGCSKSEDTPDPNGTDPVPTVPVGNTTFGKGQPSVVATAGITDWDNLSMTEKNRIKSWNTIFMHQSVGGDLEDGANNNGFKFAYFDLNEKPNKGLSGNVFSVSNGDPLGKIAEFKRNTLAHKSLIKIAIFKFGYADINDGNTEQVKTAYKQILGIEKYEIYGAVEREDDHRLHFNFRSEDEKRALPNFTLLEAQKGNWQNDALNLTLAFAYHRADESNVWSSANPKHNKKIVIKLNH